MIQIIYLNGDDRILISVDNSDVSNVYENYEEDDVYCFDKPIDNKWITERRKNKQINTRNSSLREFEPINSFKVLDNYENKQIDTDDVNKIRGNEIVDDNINYNATIKNRVYVNKYPEREVNDGRNFHRICCKQTLSRSNDISIPCKK